ncbi:MAG: DNA primase [Candidatus Omnitrophica bacterium]|nr:DNA primase [Candidatus Omnitrophota bacterium]
MAYSEKILEEILNRIDIVELISSYIPLKRAGRNFKALCPFHQEKTPSFMVSPQKQIYHCFGCHSGGNAFSFLMRYEHIEFNEAVRMLAKKAGITLQQTQDRDNSFLIYYKINQLTADFYQNLLNSPEGSKAVEYLRNRKINESIQKLLKIGFASSRWDALLQYLRERDYSVSVLEKLGLILSKENGGYYDRFRNRIIFPIFDIKSRIIGFGARIIQEDVDKDQAKYLNSPTTPLYTKGEHLYGLNLAKEHIIRNDSVIVVEGYFDFIVPFQAGLKNIVASLGTAFTPEQARTIKRYTHNVIMVYDGDNAGQLATLRSLDTFLEEDMVVKIVDMPAGFDPDLYVRTYGIEALNNLIINSRNIFDYKLAVLKSMYDRDSPEGKTRIASEMLTTISKLTQPISRATYIKMLSEEIDIREDALLLQLKRAEAYTSCLEKVDFNFKSSEKVDVHPTEKLLIRLMLEEEDIIKRLKEMITPEDFQNEKTSQIVSILFDLVSQGKKIMVNNLLNYFPQQDNILPLLCELSLSPSIDDNDKEKIIEDCVYRLKERKIKIQRENLHREIKLAQRVGDTERLNILIKEFCRLSRSMFKKER